MSDDAPDLTEFFKYSKPPKPPCKIGAILGTGSKLKGPEKDQLVSALATDSSIITASAVIKWLEVRKVPIELNTNNVTNHRAGKCSCARET